MGTNFYDIWVLKSDSFQCLSALSLVSLEKISLFAWRASRLNITRLDLSPWLLFAKLLFFIRLKTFHWPRDRAFLFCLNRNPFCYFRCLSLYLFLFLVFRDNVVWNQWLCHLIVLFCFLLTIYCSRVLFEFQIMNM